MVTDNGEPGRDDRFAFATNTGFAVTGTLDQGGNIQLHKVGCE